MNIDIQLSIYYVLKYLDTATELSFAFYLILILIVFITFTWIFMINYC